MLNLVVCICTAFNVFQIKQMGFLLSTFVHGLRAWEKEVCKRSLSHIGVGRGGGQGGGGGGGQAPQIILEGANIPFAPPPPNYPPTFSFNFYVKQEKITNVPS